MLFRQADYPTMEWINKNIPANKTILINPFPWGYGLYAGNDGGYWISPLANRPTMPPPALYGLSPKLSRDVKQISKNVIAYSDNLPKLHEILIRVILSTFILGREEEFYLRNYWIIVHYSKQFMQKMAHGFFRSFHNFTQFNWKIISR